MLFLIAALRNISIWVGNNQTLLPGVQSDFHVTMHVTGPYTSINFHAYMHVDELERPITVQISVLVKDHAPRLQIHPGMVNAEVARGSQELLTVIIENIGGADSGPLSARIANNPIVRLATAGVVKSLSPGNSPA